MTMEDERIEVLIPATEDFGAILKKTRLCGCVLITNEFIKICAKHDCEYNPTACRTEKTILDAILRYRKRHN
jgi:hypothetical protein